ncbi:MAG: hypothetical protein GY765_18370 [bacterium]|nr:hypothetical protein [bacterium]
MLGEFKERMRVDADYAHFDAGVYTYMRDWPFYSTRFVTAMIFQAILEVEGGCDEAYRIMKWLLDVPSYQWNTTQTNFWILSALKTYSRTVEKEPPGKTEMTIAGKTMVKHFRSKKESWEVEKKLETAAKPFKVEVKAKGNVYLTTELQYRGDGELPESRGIRVKRNVYNKEGKLAGEFIKGEVYQVELLVESEQDVPYGALDEPVAAGFEIIRDDFDTGRKVEEFNKDNAKEYHNYFWAWKEHAADRIIVYSYRYKGKKRFIYFIKALYTGTFTWMPTTVQGMYHPRYYGREAVRKIEVK